MAKTFFQAIDDKDTRRDGRTFEGWLEQAKSRFTELMGVERYAYEVLHAFYPKAGIDAIVPSWESGTLPAEYAVQQFRAARPQKDLL